MILYANKKFIDASRVVHLLAAGEKYADELIFSVDRTYNGKDLSDCLFVIRGVNSAGGLIREALSSNTDKETILLTWNVSPAFTAVPGMLALEIVCYDNESMILKYTISPLQVRESVLEGYSGGTDAIEEAIKEMEQILNENRLVSVNLPKIENGNWQLYNPETGTYEDSGQPVHGANGKDGQNGESAYEMAVKNGFSGTESEWLESLKGADGLPGKDGINGQDGKSAYQIWLDAGNAGTEKDFIASLKGDKGDIGKNGVPGENGASAYEIAVKNGFIGTESEWLESLKGEQGSSGADGEDGDSAYQIWLDAGNLGTEEDFLTSLKGVKGDIGEQGLPGTNGLPGKDGEKGADGINGQDGKNGVSPTVTLTEQDGGILVSITDAEGTHTAFIRHGNDVGVDLSPYAKTETVNSQIQVLSESIISSQQSISQKVDKVEGKVLSSNDYTDAEKNKLAGIESGAQKNVITGVKGNAETAYRTGNINLTPANIGAAAATHTHNYAGSVSAGGAANSAAKLSTARNINGVSFDGTANITIPRSIKHIHIASGVEGQIGYSKVCSIKVTGGYADHPLRFTVTQRRVPHYDIVFLFNNSGNADPPVDEAYYFSLRKGENPYIYYVKSGTSTYDIYIKKTEPYDHIYILDYQKADGIEGLNYTLTWTNELVTTLPTGYVKLSNAIGTMAVKDANDYASAGHTHSEATTNKAGLMSAADKAKLDKIGSGTLIVETTGTSGMSVEKIDLIKYPFVYIVIEYTYRGEMTICTGIMPVLAAITAGKFVLFTQSTVSKLTFTLTCTVQGVIKVNCTDSSNNSGSIKLSIYTC